MGLSSAQDEYGRRGDEAIEGLASVAKVVDDILVYGSTPQAHLNSVIKVLDRCRERKVTLNPKKFQFCCQRVGYVGYIVTPNGYEADPAKVDAIQRFPTPTNLTELRSFFGLVNQLGDFSPEISAAAEPLRGLL